MIHIYFYELQVFDKQGLSVVCTKYLIIVLSFTQLYTDFQCIKSSIVICVSADHPLQAHATLLYVQEAEDRVPIIWRLPLPQVCQGKVSIVERGLYFAKRATYM